jgi:hypothetical protein
MTVVTSAAIEVLFRHGRWMLARQRPNDSFGAHGMERTVAMARVTKNGGQVVSPAISIPAGTFAYCLDPDGNSFGLFV